MRLERSGKSVRLFSKGGTDWTKRYPWVVETERLLEELDRPRDGRGVPRVDQILGEHGDRSGARA